MGKTSTFLCSWSLDSYSKGTAQLDGYASCRNSKAAKDKYKTSEFPCDKTYTSFKHEGLIPLAVRLEAVELLLCGCVYLVKDKVFCLGELLLCES